MRASLGAIVAGLLIVLMVGCQTGRAPMVVSGEEPESNPAPSEQTNPEDVTAVPATDSNNPEMSAVASPLATLEGVFVYPDTSRIAMDQTIRYSVQPGVPETETRSGKIVHDGLPPGNYVLVAFDKNKKRFEIPFTLEEGLNRMMFQIAYPVRSAAAVSATDSTKVGDGNRIVITPPTK